MSQSSFDSEFASVVRPEVLTTFGQAATLRRRSESQSLSVIVDQEEIRAKTQQNHTATRMQSILLCSVADYTLNDVARTPEPIDTITVGTVTYQLRQPSSKSRCWEYTDGTRQMFKLYVEEV